VVELFAGNQKVSLARKIGKGGEGEVFAIEGNPKLAAKLYYKKIRSHRKSKVGAIVQAQLHQSTDLISFPKEILIDRDGEFVGFLMNMVDGHLPMHELYGTKSRKVHYPGVDFRFVVRAACNVARAIAKVHSQNLVIGDFNYGGVLISRKAMVALIDADSFQYSFLEKTYFCEVGMPEYTPPELQGVALKGVVRKKSSDLFGLAVAIFQLLFLGRHPHAGLGGPETLEEAIKQNCFSYSIMRQGETKTKPPSGMFTLKDFPLDIANAFEMAFGKNSQSRPAAEYWVEVLQKLERSLSKCSVQPSHYFPSGSGSCLWCKCLSRFGLEMYPALQKTTTSADYYRVDTEVDALINELKKYQITHLDGVLPVLSTPVRESAKVAAEIDGDDNSFDRVIGWSLITFALIGVYNYLNPLWLILAGIGYYMSTKDTEATRKRHRGVVLRNRYEDSDKALKIQYTAFLSKTGYSELQATAKSLEKTIALCLASDDELNRKLHDLKSESRRKQTNSFLDRYRIQDANISGIGPSKKAKLRSFGIETAADISFGKVRAVPGFGEVFTAKMVDWRKSHEAGFRYDKNAHTFDTQEEDNVRGTHLSNKQAYLAKMRFGLRSLKSFSVEKLKKEAELNPLLMKALKERAKAEGDLKSLKISVPASVIPS